MPLHDGYGVLVGSLQSYACDRPDHDRQYFHCNLRVKAGHLIYRCPVDLDSKNASDGIQWRIVELGRTTMKGITGLRDGWHPLLSNRRSGAFDYYRSEELQPTGDCAAADEAGILSVTKVDGTGCTPWLYGTGAEAFRSIEPLFKHLRRIYVFGEPFRNGKGVHNIHQNQGDPPDSRWRGENGVWQDGCVVAERWNHTLEAFLCKFKTQCFAFDQQPGSGSTSV
jgi:hypothetical protein